MKNRNSKIWEVPYLPIDPSDIGRVYEPVVRINSQSGKGGVAFVMNTYYGFKLPKGMHREFADVVQAMSEKQGEVPPEQIMDAFRKEYLYKNEPLHFRKLQVTDMSSDNKTDFDTKVRVVFRKRSSGCCPEGLPAQIRIQHPHTGLRRARAQIRF